MADAGPAPTQDALLGGRVRLLQRARGHRAGTDAVLLAASFDPRPGDIVVDLGAGTGAVGLMVAALAPEARVVFVERDDELAALCRLNVVANGCADRALIVRANVLAGPVVEHARVDCVLTNPPFFEAMEAPRSPEPTRAEAHVMPRGGLAVWIGAAIRMLRPRGRLGLIQRADKLAACLDALAGKAGSIEFRAIHPRAEAEATRVIVTAVKGGRAPLRVLAPLVLHGPDGRFTPQAEAIHRGERVISGERP
ncbi:MAG: methyltransferase [Salinarimonadaceae bacterium]|nr:MAG: methyltransferase [Salinarimonadaceae bacterium]